MTFDLIHTSGPVTDAAMAEAVERELTDFDDWFTRPLSAGGAGNAPMIPMEKALLRTYLLARLSGRYVPPRAS